LNTLESFGFELLCGQTDTKQTHWRTDRRGWTSYSRDCRHHG